MSATERRLGWSFAIVSLALTTIVSAGALPAPTDRAAAQTTPRPNILLFLTDDQRAGDTLTKTVMPNVRAQILQRGKRFTNLFATTPLCCPDRSVLLSGRYAHNTGVRTNPDGGALDHSASVAHELSAAGYTTAIVGKFLNGWKSSTPPPFFDFHALTGGGYEDQWFNVDGVAVQPPYTTDFIGEQGIRYLERFEDADPAPWMMILSTPAPHYPWHPSPEHADDPVGAWDGNPATAEIDRSDKPPWVTTRSYDLARAQLVRTPQLRTLMSVDDMVGAVMTRLHDLDELANTLVVYTSDNGYLWADHRLGGDYGTAAQKRFPYTASIRIPYLMRWDGHLAPGAVDRRVAGSVDLAPTMLDAAGRPPTYPLDGHSLLDPALRHVLLLEYWTDPGDPAIPTWRSLRSRKMQFVEWFDVAGNVSFREYYDLRTDPWQLTNLLADGDPSNDPPIDGLVRRSSRMATCGGTASTTPDPTNPCP
jgi:arylsulfatase A-like enzyme